MLYKDQIHKVDSSWQCWPKWRIWVPKCPNIAQTGEPQRVAFRLNPNSATINDAYATSLTIGPNLSRCMLQVEFKGKYARDKRLLNNTMPLQGRRAARREADCHATKSHPMSWPLSTATAYKVAWLLIGLFNYPIHRSILSNLLKPWAK